jgi:two-component system nitrogen regulation sensor histidine kinase GlnL
MKHPSPNRSQTPPDNESAVSVKDSDDTVVTSRDIFADMEQTLDQVAKANPRLEHNPESPARGTGDLKELLQVSLAINSSLVLDDLLQMVMHKAIELMQAERGLIMLLDEQGELQLKSAYNLCKEQMMEEDFRISNSVTTQVARTAKAVYTSDAMADDRYSHQRSVVELHLRSIMCAPIIVRERVIGVIYLDNSSESKMFLKSDLYLFQLYAQMVSNALHNAGVYEKLLRMEQYHESVVSTAPVGIVVLDTQGRLATINPTALEVFELNRDTIELIGGSTEPTVFLTLLPENEQIRWQRMINTVVTSGQEFADARYYHNTGYVEKVLSVKITPILGLPNGHNGLAMTVEDVTEKVTMEQYVILSEKLVARGEMAASVAHELNNYLSIMSNNAELLAVNIDREKYDKVKFNGKSITENVFKIKRFVDSLMDFSKPEPEYISYDIKHLVDDLLFSLRIQPRFKLVQFSINLNDTIPNMEVDVGQIQQVLMNLLNNAADAIEERAASLQLNGEKMERRIGLVGRYNADFDSVIIEVSDNGSGMSPETLGKVFTLHFSTKKGGHGLGLHNCKKIIEQHDGRLEVRSKLNEGTTFVLTLPRFQPKKVV